MNKVIYTTKKRQRTQAKMDGRVINLPSVAITIASRSLPPYLRVTLALLSGATLNGSPFSFLLTFLVSTIHVVLST